MHDINVESYSQILQNKKIALVCGGGIAAIEMPRVARELRRHGATVQFFVTANSLNFVGITSLEWSSQNPVITESSGLSEHVCTADAILVAPATANLISSARHGLCHNSATTLIQSAFGQNIPVIFMPTMHNSMLNSPIIQENITLLKTLKNVFFIEPRQEENKAKILSPDTLALTCAHYINKYIMAQNKSVLISLGGTRVMIDPVRCLSNLSTGRLGWETTKLFYAMGYNVSVVAGQIEFELYPYQEMHLQKCSDYFEIYDHFKNLNTDCFNGFFHFLAGIDYTPDRVCDQKLDSTNESLTLTLKSVPKIRTLENLQKIPYKFFCKLTTHDDPKTRQRVQKFFKISRINGLLWNTAHGAWNEKKQHCGILMTNKNNKIESLSITGKEKIARCIYEKYTQ